MHAKCILGYNLTFKCSPAEKRKKESKILCILKVTLKNRPEKDSVAWCFYFTKERTSRQMCSIILSTYQQSPGSSKMLLISMLYWMLEGKNSKLSIMFSYKYCQIYPWFQSGLIKIDLMLPPVGHLQTETPKIRLHVTNCRQHNSIAYTLPTTNQRRYTGFFME